jgi:hypothetical protein
MARQDRAGAERIWTEWTARLGVDPDRPPGPASGAPRDTRFGGFRVVTP